MHKREVHVDYLPEPHLQNQKERVAAYARVSSEREESFHSLSAQIKYYKEKIESSPGA